MSQNSECAPICRMARYGERDRFYAIWEDAFHDDKAFMDWLFDARFAPAFCPVVEVNGEIAACAHALPATIRVRDALLPCALLGGVATLPAFRRQGMMHRLLTYFMRAMRARGIALIPHRPQKLDTFFSIGHYPVCDMQYARHDPAYAGRRSPAVRTGDWRADASGIYACYLAFSRRYSGVIFRSFADFSFKMSEYGASGARLFVYEARDDIRGYAVAFDGADGVFLDECVAAEDMVYQALFDALAADCGDRPITARLPADVRIQAGAICETMPRAVIGVADAPALLRATGLTGGAVRITDGIVPENNGVFSLDGCPTNEPPKVALSAGHLAQWALGYKTVAALAEAGEGEILDASHGMDALGTAACYIVDEY